MPDHNPLFFNRRIGFHYFPDTRHYRQQDLDTWLPELHRLGAAWITLLAPSGRAIPESFLSGLLSAGIQPLLHFVLPLAQPSRSADWPLLFSQYARWGVRYLAFYDGPNRRTAWPAAAWAQSDLVERFLDSFLPLAEAAHLQGLSPVFPPLEPGGDFWDLAFLRLALRSLQRRATPGLLDTLALGVYAWIDDRPIDWGAGGPQRWPGARPYAVLSGIEDQRGFRIFDWYLAVAEQEIGRRLPVLGLRAGQRLNAATDQAGRQVHARHNLAAARLLAAEDARQAPFSHQQVLPPQGDFAGEGEPASSASPSFLEASPEIPGTSAGPGVPAGNPLHQVTCLPLPPEVLACNFWLLAALPGSPYAAQAWYPSQGEPLPVVHAFAQWVAYYRRLNHAATLSQATPQLLSSNSSPASSTVSEPQSPPLGSARPADISAASTDGTFPPSAAAVSPLSTEGEGGPAGEAPSSCSQAEPLSPIAHYILLPLYAWGASSWDLALIQPLLDETHPTVGFSLVEARLARRVTVVAGAISDSALQMLHQSGCQVERLLEDGTLVAT